MQAGRLIEVIIYIKHHLGPLIGGRLIERYFIVIVLQIFWDFDMRPFNRGWPLNGGSTVIKTDSRFLVESN